MSSYFWNSGPPSGDGGGAPPPPAPGGGSWGGFMPPGLHSGGPPGLAELNAVRAQRGLPAITPGMSVLASLGTPVVHPQSYAPGTGVQVTPSSGSQLGMVGSASGAQNWFPPIGGGSNGGGDPYGPPVQGPPGGNSGGAPAPTNPIYQHFYNYIMSRWPGFSPPAWGGSLPPKAY